MESNKYIKIVTQNTYKGKENIKGLVGDGARGLMCMFKDKVCNVAN
jgi:hypothetical protein